MIWLRSFCPADLGGLFPQLFKHTAKRGLEARDEYTLHRADAADWLSCAFQKPSRLCKASKIWPGMPGHYKEFAGQAIFSQQELDWLSLREFDGAADVADVLFLIIDAQLFVERGEQVGYFHGMIFDEHPFLVALAQHAAAGDTRSRQRHREG